MRVGLRSHRSGNGGLTSHLPARPQAVEGLHGRGGLGGLVGRPLRLQAGRGLPRSALGAAAAALCRGHEARGGGEPRACIRGASAPRAKPPPRPHRRAPGRRCWSCGQLLPAWARDLPPPPPPPGHGRPPAAAGGQQSLRAEREILSESFSLELRARRPPRPPPAGRSPGGAPPRDPHLRPGTRPPSAPRRRSGSRRPSSCRGPTRRRRPAPPSSATSPSTPATTAAASAPRGDPHGRPPRGNRRGEG